jgi:hypothetical protein
LIPIWWLQSVAFSMDTVAVVVVAAASVIALVFVTISPRFALVLPAVVLAWFAFATERLEFFEHGFPKASVGALFQGITNPDRDWVDSAVGRAANVAFVFSGSNPTEQPLTLWENEFWNRSIGPVYDLRQRSIGGLPETPLTERRDGVLLADGQPVRPDYVLAEQAVPLAGEVVARDERRGMVLWRNDGELRIGYRVNGLYPSDTWSGKHVVYTRLRCSGGTVTARLQRDPNLIAAPQTVRAGGRQVTFAGEEASLTVPLRPRDGVCRAVFTVMPTAVPGPGDPRVLGVHFLAFDYSAP